MVADDVLRVVAHSTNLPTGGLDQAKIHHQAKLATGGFGQNKLPPGGFDGAATDYWNNLMCGPKIDFVVEGALPLGFDLHPHLRATTKFSIPPYNKPNLTCPHQAGTKCGCKKTRSGWKNYDHVNYLWVLIEGATRFLNRQVQLKDFTAILEALNRKFENSNQPCPLRGAAAVHTFVMKKTSPNFPILEALTARVMASTTA